MAGKRRTERLDQPRRTERRGHPEALRDEQLGGDGLGILVGAVIGIAGILSRGKDKNIPIPFGPYLAIAGVIALFWGEALVGYYLRFANLQ